MEALPSVCFLLLFCSTPAVSSYYGASGTRKQQRTPFPFVAAVVEKATSRVVATGAVVSPRWILTSAHLLPEDVKGIPASRYFVLAGRPLRRFDPTHVLTHPTYTWGLFTAEDLALVRVAEDIPARAVLLSGGRFPWNAVDCDFIYWSEDSSYPFVTPQSLRWFRNEITVVQNCLIGKQKVPIGLLQFYLNDILCGTARGLQQCVGKTGGLLFCENLLVGGLIRSSWCGNKTANFTDFGVFAHWISSRVADGHFVRLDVVDASASSSVSPTWPLLLLPLLMVFTFGNTC